MLTSRLTRSDRLLKVLADFQHVYIVAHNTPDPDAIASGWAVAFLVEQKLHKQARVFGGGDILRAENKHMLDLLHPPMELVRRLECPPSTAVVLVDCAVGSQNHLFADQPVLPVAVIDHHLHDGQPRRRLPFRDIRPQVAASATICACYLREQKLEPGDPLATALLYAIRTETRGNETRYSRTDRTAMLWLTERADFSKLAEIENAPLSVAYYTDLVLALQNTIIYHDAALCLLPRASAAEIIGEVADLLIRCEPVRRVFCGAVIQGDLLFSVRTMPDSGNATDLVQAMLAGGGQGGGHPCRAGGKIPGDLAGPGVDQRLQNQLQDRWLAACGLPPQQGNYLVARDEIVENL